MSDHGAALPVRLVRWDARVAFPEGFDGDPDWDEIREWFGRFASGLSIAEVTCVLPGPEVGTALIMFVPEDVAFADDLSAISVEWQ